MGNGWPHLRGDVSGLHGWMRRRSISEYRSLLFWLLFGALLFGVVTAVFAGGGLAQSETLIVGDSDEADHETITAGVENATAGDTVLVEPGMYEEDAPVVLTEPNVTLASIDGTNTTTLIGSVEVAAPGVTVDGFTVGPAGPDTVVVRETGNDAVIANVRIEELTDRVTDGVRVDPEEADITQFTLENSTITTDPATPDDDLVVTDLPPEFEVNDEPFGPMDARQLGSRLFVDNDAIGSIRVGDEEFTEPQGAVTGTVELTEGLTRDGPVTVTVTLTGADGTEQNQNVSIPLNATAETYEFSELSLGEYNLSTTVTDAPTAAPVTVEPPVAPVDVDDTVVEGPAFEIVEQRGNVTGSVNLEGPVSETAEPVTVEVTLEGQGDTNQTDTVSIPPDGVSGTYEFTDLPFGDYTVSTTVIDEPTELPVVVEPSTASVAVADTAVEGPEFDVLAQRGDISGNITISDAVAAELEPDDEITVNVTATNGESRSTTVTLDGETDGATYTVEEVLPDTYTMSATVAAAETDGDVFAALDGSTEVVVDADALSVDGPDVSVIGESTFQVTDLDPEAVTVEQDEGFTVTATITNPSVVGGEEVVTLSVDDTPRRNQTVSLDPGEQTTLNFSDVDPPALEIPVGDEESVPYTVTTEDSVSAGNLTVTNPSPFDGGDGTEANPFQIANAAQFDQIRTDPTANYELVADVDMTELNDSFTPIAGPFTGELAGNGHAVAGLTIANQTVPAQGLGVFNETDTATLTDVEFASPAVIASNQSTNGSIGLLAGEAHDTSLTGVTVTNGVVNVTEPASGTGIGGLVGGATETTAISNSTVDTTVEVTATGEAPAAVGGVVGESAGEFVMTSTDVTTHPTVTGEATITDVGGLVGHAQTLTVDKTTVTTDSTVTVRETATEPDTGELRRVGGLVGEASGDTVVTETTMAGDMRAGSNASGVAAVGGLAGKSGAEVVTDTVENRINTTVGGTTALFVGGWVGDASAATLDVNASHSRSATTVGSPGAVIDVGHFAGNLRTNGTMQASSVDGVIHVGGPTDPLVADRIDDLPLDFGTADRALLLENVGGAAGTADQPGDTAPDTASGISTDDDPRGLTVEETVVRTDKNLKADDSANIGRFSGRLIGQLDLSDVFLGGTITPLEELDASGIVNDASDGTVSTDNTTYNGNTGPSDPVGNGSTDGSPSDDPSDIPPGLDEGDDENGNGDTSPSAPDEPSDDDSPFTPPTERGDVTGAVELSGTAADEIGVGDATVAITLDQRGTTDSVTLDLLSQEGEYELEAVPISEDEYDLTAEVQTTDTTATFDVEPASANVTVDGDAVTGPTFEVVVTTTEFDAFEVRADELFAQQDLRFESQLAPEADVIVDRVEWNFGDGTQAQGTTAVHAYDAPGTYDVSFTLFGVDGDQETFSDEVTIEPTPNVTITDIELSADGETIGPADEVSIPNPADVPIGYDYEVTVEDARVLDEFNATVDGDQLRDANITRSGDTFTVGLGPSDIDSGSIIEFEASGAPDDAFTDNETTVETASEAITVRTFDLPQFVLVQTSPEDFDFDDAEIAVEVDGAIPPDGSTAFAIPNEYGDITTEFDPPLTDTDQETGTDVVVGFVIDPVHRDGEVSLSGSVEHDVNVTTLSGGVEGTGFIAVETPPRFDGAELEATAAATDVEVPPGGFPVPQTAGAVSVVPRFEGSVTLSGTVGEPDEPDVDPFAVEAGDGSVGFGAEQAVAADVVLVGAEAGFSQEVDTEAPLQELRPIDVEGRIFLFAEVGVGPFEQSVRIPDEEDAAVLDTTLLEDPDGQVAVVGAEENAAMTANRSTVELANVTGDVPPRIGTSAPATADAGAATTATLSDETASAPISTVMRVTEDAVDNEDPDVTPVETGSETLAVWSRQRPDKPAADGRDIVLTQLQDDESAPFENVTDTNRSEFEPVIAGSSMDDNLIAAVQVSESFDGREVTDLNEVVTATEIVTTTPDDGGWADPTTLTDTDENTLVGAPTLASNDGQWLLAWESRTDGLDSAAADHQVNYVWYDGTEFSEIETVEAARAPAVSAAPVDAATPDGFHLAYVDLGPETVSDPEADRRDGNVTVETFSGDRNHQQTERYPVTTFSSLDVTAENIAWIDANTSGAVSLATRPTPADGFGNATAPPIDPPTTAEEVALIPTTEGLAATVRGTNTDTGIAQISYTPRINDTWLPTRVYADGADQNVTFRQPVSAPTADGFITASSGKELLSEQRYDLFAFNQTFAPDLNVSVDVGPDTDIESLAVNDTATLTYSVRNDGPADAPATELVASANDTRLDTASLPALAPGANATGNLTVSVPDTGIVTVTGDPDATIDDLDRRSNTEEIQLARGTAAVDDITIADGTSTRTVTAAVTNPTNISIEPVDVTFENGPTLNETSTLGPLAPGETQTIEFAAPPTAFDTAYPVVIQTRPEGAPQTSDPIDREAVPFTPDLRFSADAVTFYEADGQVIADMVIENRGPTSVSATLAGVATSETNASLRGSLDTAAADPDPEAITAPVTADQIQSTTLVPSASGSSSTSEFTRTTLALGSQDEIDVTSDAVGLTLTANDTVQDTAVIDITDGGAALPAPEGAPPTGTINASATTITLGNTVELRAEDLRSPTSEIETFQWEIAGEDPIADEERVSVTPTELGETEIGLQIRDADGLTERLTTTITVEAGEGDVIGFELAQPPTVDRGETLLGTVHTPETAPPLTVQPVDINGEVVTDDQTVTVSLVNVETGHTVELIENESTGGDDTVTVPIDSTDAIPAATPAGTYELVAESTTDDGTIESTVSFESHLDTGQFELTQQVAEINETAAVSSPLALADDGVTTTFDTDADGHAAALVQYDPETGYHGAGGLPNGVESVHEGVIVQLMGADSPERVGFNYAIGEPDRVATLDLEPGVHLLGAAPNDITEVTGYAATPAADVDVPVTSAVVPGIGAVDPADAVVVDSTTAYWVVVEEPGERIVFSPGVGDEAELSDGSDDSADDD